jgi:hypothetical protein
MIKWLFFAFFIFTGRAVPIADNNLFITHLNNDQLHIDGHDDLELKGPIKKIVENRFDIFFRKGGGFKTDSSTLMQYVMEFDSRSRLTSEISYHQETKTQVLFDITYSDDFIEKNSFVPGEGPAFKMRYFCDKQNRIVRVEQFFPGGRKNSCNRMVAYNSNGLIHKKWLSCSDDTSIFLYNSKNQLKEFRSKRLDSLEFKCDYWYEGNVKFTKCSENIIYSYTRTYDKYGNWVKEICYKGEYPLTATYREILYYETKI